MRYFKGVNSSDPTSSHLKYLNTRLGQWADTTTMQGGWELFFFLFVFAAVVVADFFLSFLVAFFAVDGVAVATLTPPPPPLFLSPSPSSILEFQTE